MLMTQSLQVRNTLSLHHGRCSASYSVLPGNGWWALPSLTVACGCAYAAGEIEGLRERLRAMESRAKETEGEMKALKRSLRDKELSLLSGTGVLTGQLT